MSPFLDLPENGSLENEFSVVNRLAQAGFRIESAAFTITWRQIAEAIAETLIENGIDPQRLDDDLLTGMALDSHNALDDDAILAWRDIVRSKVISNPEIEPFLQLPDIEDDEGPLIEYYEYATRLGDETYYWVDGGTSADFFDDF